MEPGVDYDNRTLVEFTHARAQEFRMCYILREAIGSGKEVTSYRIQRHSCNNGQKNAQEEREIRSGRIRIPRRGYQRK